MGDEEEEAHPRRTGGAGSNLNSPSTQHLCLRVPQRTGIHREEEEDEQTQNPGGDEGVEWGRITVRPLSPVDG